MSVEGDEYELQVDIPFLAKRHAEIAHKVLRVDLEPARSKVKKNFSINENVLSIKVRAPEVRNLRVCMTNFFESLLSVVETIEEFGEENS